MSRDDDLRFMRRAVELAKLGEGATRPNPPVGAVIVKDGRIIGEGWHKKAGDLHAEANALVNCSEDPAGATIYVTLEPCSTAGRQPPCTGKIIAAKLARVVAACGDVNPKHSGRGFDLLRQSGIETETGVLAEEASALIEPFSKHILTGLPFVTLKLALTLDGKIADAAGSSKWITGSAARELVQEMRRRSDAVLIGGGTALADNPSLLYRNGASNALRVVVDTRGTLPRDLQIFTDSAKERTIIATLRNVSADYPIPPENIWRFDSIDLHELMQKLGERDCMAVLCEGGGRLAGMLHDAQLVDEYALFYAPLVLPHGRTGFDGKEVSLANVQRLELKDARQVGGDFFVRLRPPVSFRQEA